MGIFCRNGKQEVVIKTQEIAHNTAKCAIIGNRMQNVQSKPELESSFNGHFGLDKCKMPVKIDDSVDPLVDASNHRVP